MTLSLANIRHFKPPGPVGAAFLEDTTSFVRAILGPVGGGKSSVCIFDHVKNACAMPVCRDGQIRFKLATIGNTYGQMERNLFPTWKSWLPADGGNWTEAEFTGGSGRFASHKIEWDVIRAGRRVPVLFESIFAAIGEHSIEEFMRGFEPTAFWLYEMDLLPRAVLQQSIPRLGRFPAVKDLPEGASYRSYVVGDLNAPDHDSWFYEDFEENRPKDYQLYKQPSGRGPRAENIQNLPKGYYDRLVATLKNKNLIKRYVDAQYAPSMDGEPVFPEYNDDQHLSPVVLEPRAGLPIRMGVDAGLQRPAAVFAQWLPNGQWRILGEVVPGRMGAKRFANQCEAWLSANAPGFPVEIAFADPAGFTGADREVGELAWAETLMHELQVPVEPAPSNEIGLRLDGVREELTYMIDGQTPAFWLSPACRMLRKGMASHYRYQRQQVGNTTKFSDKPEKNEWSHVSDALQYLMLGSKGRAGVIYNDSRNSKPAATRHKAGGCTILKSSIRL